MENEGKMCSSGLISKVWDTTSAMEAQKIYDIWAPKFDSDLNNNGINIHAEVAKCVTKYGCNNRDTQLLDVAAGTGVVGFCLRKYENFCGEIDILDANMEMLYVASKKGLNFRNIMRHWIDGDLPLTAKSYDVITCIGSFVPRHLPPSTLQNLLKLIKDGGFLIFNGRANLLPYNNELLKMIDQLESEGQMKVVDTMELFYTSDAFLSKLYVCQVPK
uniref:Uncharacterized protein LOC101243204 n=1 Tax=Phallusia mammillata TaxID=59560 RepID=A0A6F9DJ05_9ASCI|nr:uncharacterized protein LOC101243204 [Phallusia mammillata]